MKSANNFLEKTILERFSKAISTENYLYGCEEVTFLHIVYFLSVSILIDIQYFVK